MTLRSSLVAWMWIPTLAMATVARAEYVPPPLTGPVVDAAGMLSPQTRTRLEGFIRRLYESGGPQLQVATVPDLGGVSIEEASIKTTDQWKLGGAKSDNGVLLLVARDERKVRIEVGQGLEGDLPDAYASRIIRDVIVPRFKAGDIDRGVTEGVLAIVHYTHPEFLKGQEAGRSASVEGDARGVGRNKLQLILMVIFFTFMILPMFFGGRRRRGLWGPALGGLGGLGGGGFGGGGFGGRRGGGWSGGGGGFSGGGASGGW